MQLQRHTQTHTQTKKTKTNTKSLSYAASVLCWMKQAMRCCSEEWFQQRFGKQDQQRVRVCSSLCMYVLCMLTFYTCSRTAVRVCDLHVWFLHRFHFRSLCMPVFDLCLMALAGVWVCVRLCLAVLSVCMSTFVCILQLHFGSGLAVVNPQMGGHRAVP